MRENTFVDFLRITHEIAQKGEYIPDYYIVRYEVEHPEDLPDVRGANYVRNGTFCDEIRMAGGKASHIIPLRALDYLFNNREDKYLNEYISTGVINRLMDDPETRQYLERKMAHPDSEERVLCAIETRMGVLFFDVNGWGKECRQAYLQYLANNYFNKEGAAHGYVREYRINDPSPEMVRSKEDSPHAFSLYNFDFMSHKARYHNRALLGERHVFRACDMNPDYDSYHSFVNSFHLTTNVTNVQVLRLLYMRALGHMQFWSENKRIALLGSSEFRTIQNEIDVLSRDPENNKQKISALQRSISDKAADILQKNYHVAPSPFFRERKTLHEQKHPASGVKKARKIHHI